MLMVLVNAQTPEFQLSGGFFVARYITAFCAIFLSTYASANPVMIFMGGFGSCPLAGDTSELKSADQMDAMVARAQESSGKEVIAIRTCYAIGSDNLYVTAPDLNLNSESMTRSSFHDVVRLAVKKAGDNAPVYVWGQSHGGWTAMDLVRKVSHTNYRILMTIDPISIPDCGPVVFSGGAITGSAPGCQRAPKDLEPDYELIRSRVHSWSHWYQTEFTLLHSDRINYASENIERFFNASWWILMGAHRLTETDEVMWRDATEKVAKDLAVFEQ